MQYAAHMQRCNIPVNIIPHESVTLHFEPRSQANLILFCHVL